MDDPLFTSTNIVGGSSARYSFSAMGKEIHSNQSFILTQTFTASAGGAFDISSATSTLYVAAYKNASLDSVALTSGVLSDSGSGTTDTVTFTVPKDLIPTGLGSFPQRNGGNAVFYYILEDTDSVLEFGQGVNVIDPSYGLTGEVDPGASTITTQRNDLGTVEDTSIVTPPAQTFGLAYVVGPAGATGDWVGQEDNLAVSNGSSWIFTLPEEGNFVFNKAIGAQEVFDGAAWDVSAGGDMLASTYDPTAVAADAFARSNMVGTQAHTTISDYDTELAGTANVTTFIPPLDYHPSTKKYVDDSATSLPVIDTTAIVQDPVDATKQMRIDVGGVGTAQTRVVSMPDQDIDLTPGSGSFIKDIVSDVTPQLGGTLDSNSNDIDMGDDSDILNVKNLDFNSYTELTISSNIVAVTQALHSLDTQADAATDDLDTITLGDSNLIFIQLNNVARIVTLKDGQECLDYLFSKGEYADEPHDFPLVILLDLNMPRVGGLEVLERLRADKRTRLIPVIVLTTSDADVDIDTAYDLGANSFITKPMRTEDFFNTIQEIELYWTLHNKKPNY